MRIWLDFRFPGLADLAKVCTWELNLHLRAQSATKKTTTEMLDGAEN